MMYSCLFLFARGTILIAFVVLGAAQDLDNIGPNYVGELMLRLLIAIAITLIGFVAVRAAVAQKGTVEAQPPVASGQNPL